MESIYSDILIGQADDRQVYIEFCEYLKILKFAKAGAVDGTRGVLLGWKNAGKIYITKVIEAVYTGNEGFESPSFSPQSWGRILSEIKKDFGSLSLLGQFSTHSSVAPVRNDYIMQEKYFDNNSDLLYIFDPADNSEKMYFYKGREFNFLNGFYLFDKFENPIDLNARENILRPLAREYELRMRMFDDINRKLKSQNNFYAILAIIIFVLMTYNIIHFYRLEKTFENYSLSNEEKIEWKKE